MNKELQLNEPDYYCFLGQILYHACESAAAGFTLRRGWRALTTIVMFGRKSASYWTQSAATAASWDIQINITKNQDVSNI